MFKYLLACAFACSFGLGAARAEAPPWEERHGLTADEFEKASKELAEKEYRLVQISGATVGKEVQFTAVWEKHPKDAPAREARHALTAKQYEKTAAELKDKGFHVIELSGYDANGDARFVAIWEKAPKDAPPREAHHNLTSDKLRDVYADLTKKEYRPLRVSGYAVGKETRYATVWEKPKDKLEWEARRDLTPDQYQDVFNGRIEKKQRLVHVCGYTVDGQERFAGVWEKSTVADWYAYHGMDANRYKNALAELKEKGLRPVQVSSYSVNGQLRFAALWVKE